MIKKRDFLLGKNWFHDCLDDVHLWESDDRKHEIINKNFELATNQAYMIALEEEVANQASTILGLKNDLTAVTRDRDEWRESCKMANRRFEQNDHATKENVNLRKMLKQVLGLRNWLEFQLLRVDIEKLLKKDE